MKKLSAIRLFIFSALVSGCSVFSPYAEIHEIEKFTLVEADVLTIFRKCDGADGCFDPNSRTMFIIKGDWNIAGHELCHDIHGDPDHEKECSIWMNPELGRVD